MTTSSITISGVITAEGGLELKQRLPLPPGPVEVTVTAIGTATEDDRKQPESGSMEVPQIINRGRGPEIKGTRITVYDVLDYYRDGHDPAFIAALFRLSTAQILAAIQYIEEHKEQVWSKYRKILERDARGNPPELQAKLDAIHAECQALWAERRRQGKLPELISDERDSCRQ